MAKNKETGGRVSKETRLLLLKRLHEARTAARAAEARATMYGRLLLAAEESEEEQEQEFNIRQE